MSNDAAVVFVHGIFSSPSTWESLAQLLANDPELSQEYDTMRFAYHSPHWNWRPVKRIPDFNIIADSLSTFMEVECGSYRQLVLVSHSQGGLVVQRYLARMIGQGRGRELAKIRRVVLLACPNNGSELFLLVRKSAKFWRHPQERELRPLSESVTEAQRSVLNSIVFADHVGADQCPIPFAVYAGESDNIVTPASARSVFPRAGAIPGDHNSILRAESTTHRTFTTIKANLLLALREPSLESLHRTNPQNYTSDRLGSLYREPQTPVMKVTTTTTEGPVSRSQEIEIFDTEAAELWIHSYRTSPITQEQSDAE